MPKYKAKIAFFAEYNATVVAPSEESSMAIAEREFLTQVKPMLSSVGITNVEISFEDVKEICPCIGCIYFDTCGDEDRTKPCNGRQTKSKGEE